MKRIFTIGVLALSLMIGGVSAEAKTKKKSSHKGTSGSVAKAKLPNSTGCNDFTFNSKGNYDWTDNGRGSCDSGTYAVVDDAYILLNRAGGVYVLTDDSMYTVGEDTPGASMLADWLMSNGYSCTSNSLKGIFSYSSDDNRLKYKVDTGSGSVDLKKAEREDLYWIKK